MQGPHCRPRPLVIVRRPLSVVRCYVFVVLSAVRCSRRVRWRCSGRGQGQVAVGCRVNDHSRRLTSPVTPFIFCCSLFVVSWSVFVAAGVFVLGRRVGGRSIMVMLRVKDKGESAGKPTPSPSGIVHDSA